MLKQDFNERNYTKKTTIFLAKIKASPIYELISNITASLNVRVVEQKLFFSCLSIKIINLPTAPRFSLEKLQYLH